MKKGCWPSDGDVALHALTDAAWRRGAGRYRQAVPDTDPAFKGADSRELLREAWRRIQAGLYARQRRRHDYCPGAENAAAYSADARLYR